MTSLQLASLPPLTAAVSDSLFPRILLGIDFGSASLAAARWATAHVAPCAHAILSHVVANPAATGFADADDLATSDEPHPRRSVPALVGGLRGFAATIDAATIGTAVRVGQPSRWLSALANGAEASLVVLGRRADANRKRVGEPNVIERLARRTSASVLVVPEGAATEPRRILAAVDESEFAPRVIRVARWLARLHGLPLTVLHVLSPAAGAYDRVITRAREKLTPARRTDVSDASAPTGDLPVRTARWLTELVPSRDPATLARHDRAEVALGDPAREIAAAAASADSTLVVVGVRGSDDAPPGSLGSVARELLTRAPVPVLAVNGV